MSVNRMHEFEQGKSPEFNLLGVTGGLHLGQGQVSPLYRAESSWRASDPKAGRTISLGAARDLTGELIHHQSMDEIPGIETVRANYSRHKFQQLPGVKRVTGVGAATNGLGVTLFDKSTPLSVGAVTHEAVHHMLGRAQDDPTKIGHNWAFGRAHVWGAQEFLGNTSGRNLASHYVQNNVNFGQQMRRFL